MASLKDLLTTLYTKANAYDALNTLVGQNGEKIATNINKLESVDSQISDLYSKMSQLRDVKYFDNEVAYQIGALVEVDGVIYKCIKNTTAGTTVDNTEFWTSISGGSTDLTEVNSQIASIKTVTDQIQFEDVTLGDVTYSLVTKKVEETSEDPEQNAGE